jgi:diguanylate cyclase (GGDEF)-like protein
MPVLQLFAQEVLMTLAADPGNADGPGIERSVIKVQELSLVDELTGLLNRRGFFVVADPALCSVARRGASCLVAFLDVGGLTKVNDDLGRDVGDDMLCDIASVLLQTLRRSDVVARSGGSKFCIFAADPTGDIDGLRKRIEAAFAEFNDNDDLPYQLSAAIGLAHVTPSHADTLEDLIAIARADMHNEEQLVRQRNDRHLQPLRLITDGPAG